MFALFGKAGLADRPAEQDVFEGGEEEQVFAGYTDSVEALVGVGEAGRAGFRFVHGVGLGLGGWSLRRMETEVWMVVVDGYWEAAAVGELDVWCGIQQSDLGLIWSTEHLASAEYGEGNGGVRWVRWNA